MRVTTVFFALLAAATSVAARPGKGVYARGSQTTNSYARSGELSARAANIVASRQHQARGGAPGSLLDICINLNTDTILGNSELLGIPLNDILGLDLCLCLSALPIKLGLSAQLDALINKHGAPLINLVLELLINTSPAAKHCTYPPHSKGVCSDDPCGFTCDYPYVKRGDECVCAAPNVMCGGQCVPSSTGLCPSAVANPLARRSTLLNDAQSSCKSNESVCGVYGDVKDAYECVDTKKNLESCGGCMVPNPFASDKAFIPGVDCSAIEGADEVSCVSGGCVITSCLPEWELNDDRTGCEPSTTSSFDFLAVVADVLIQQ